MLEWFGERLGHRWFPADQSITVIAPAPDRAITIKSEIGPTPFRDRLDLAQAGHRVRWRKLTKLMLDVFRIIRIAAALRLPRQDYAVTTQGQPCSRGNDVFQTGNDAWSLDACYIPIGNDASIIAYDVHS